MPNSGGNKTAAESYAERVDVSWLIWDVSHFISTRLAFSVRFFKKKKTSQIDFLRELNVEKYTKNWDLLIWIIPLQTGRKLIKLNTYFDQNTVTICFTYTLLFGNRTLCMQCCQKVYVKQPPLYFDRNTYLICWICSATKNCK